jgi:hypothetical protein
MSDPTWWSDEHTSAWGRVKAALRRDWEQTKADVSSRGTELNQGVTDTVKQAVGNEPVPPGNQQTPKTHSKDETWEHVEAAHRYGVGARHHHGAKDAGWNDGVESKLKEEWGDMRNGRTWDEVRASVKRAWDSVRR